MLDGQDVLAALRDAFARSFDLMDGSGARCAGSAAGSPARRDQALLTLFDDGGPRTRVLRFDDRATCDGAAYELSAAFLVSRAAGLSYRPGSIDQLEHFEPAPHACWRWRLGAAVLERRLRLLDGHRALLASWRLLEGPAVSLTVAPLLVDRAPRALQAEQADFAGATQGIPGRVRLETGAGAAPLTLWHNGAFVPARSWQRGIAYPLETAPADGDPSLPVLASEDACVPGWVQGTLAAPGAALHIVIAPDEALFRALAAEQRLGTPPARTLDACLAAIDAGAEARRTGWRRFARTGADFTARQAAIARGGPGESRAREPQALLAGDDAWTDALSSRLHAGLTRRHGRLTLGTRADGREPGALTLRATAAFVSLRAFETARAIARGYLDYLDEGLAAEAFAPDGRPLHGDPEATLWLIHLVELLARRDPEGSAAFVRESAWPALEGVMQHLRSGARGGVVCERDGLLWEGEGAGREARADHNALWYHALVAMAQLAKRVGRREHSAFSLAWAHELQRAYLGAFTDSATGALLLARTATGGRRGVAPDQLWAAALSPALVEGASARALVTRIERELLTRDGLTPRPGDGTPDPAWLGAWAAAHLRTHGRDGASIRRVRERFARTARRLAPGGLDALSAGVLLHAWIEDVDHATDLSTVIAG